MPYQRGKQLGLQGGQSEAHLPETPLPRVQSHWAPPRGWRHRHMGGDPVRKRPVHMTCSSWKHQKQLKCPSSELSR